MKSFKYWKSKAVGRQYKLNLIRKLIRNQFDYSAHYSKRIANIREHGLYAYTWWERFKSLFTRRHDVVIFFNDKKEPYLGESYEAECTDSNTDTIMPDTITARQ